MAPTSPSWSRPTSLALRPVGGVDPDLRAPPGDRRRWTAANRGSTSPPAPGTQPSHSDAWPSAHELVGCSRAMLDLACEHARGRIQFDRPIASFQAVRHRLAETLVAVGMAEAMLDAAWLDPTPPASSMAKAVAGRQAHTAARHCQQVLAGIGFTVEHPFHRYVRRTLVLDALLGTAASLTTSLGVGLARAAAAATPAAPLTGTTCPTSGDTADRRRPRGAAGQPGSSRTGVYSCGRFLARRTLCCRCILSRISARVPMVMVPIRWAPSCRRGSTHRCHSPEIHISHRQRSLVGTSAGILPATPC